MLPGLRYLKVLQCLLFESETVRMRSEDINLPAVVAAPATSWSKLMLFARMNERTLDTSGTDSVFGTLDARLSVSGLVSAGRFAVEGPD